MSKVDPRKINIDAKKKYLDLLWSSIAKLATRGEVEIFFKDLLSESEALMLSRRIEIARRLLNGESYDSIARELKVGMDTINRVQRWLIAGSGGYKKAIEKISKETKKNFNRSEREDAGAAYSFNWIRRKYPLHFLLFNLISDAKKKKSHK
ncbi:MAG: YerC/YecD family TrpR-related protein [Candidatus Paceibacterota bacterium]|jgi:TrpR-related protein YerC/YecD